MDCFLAAGCLRRFGLLKMFFHSIMDCLPNEKFLITKETATLEIESRECSLVILYIENSPPKLRCFFPLRRPGKTLKPVLVTFEVLLQNK